MSLMNGDTVRSEAALSQTKTQPGFRTDSARIGKSASTS